jgi:hypothetical protein
VGKLLLGILLMGAIIGMATWSVYWRQLRRLPAVSARLEHPAVISAVVVDGATILLVFGQSEVGDGRPAGPVQRTLTVVDDDGPRGRLELLDQWCATGTRLLMREDRVEGRVTLREPGSSQVVDLRSILHSNG